MNNPPIMQLALTLSFSPALDSLTMIDIADLYANFRQEFPIFGQINRASSMSYEPFDASTTKPGMPRVVFAGPNTAYQIAFQADRLTVLWNRLTPLNIDPSYPGFQSMVERLFSALEKIKAWAAARSLPELKPSVGEVAYIDALPLGPADGPQSRTISDILTVVNPDVKFPMALLNYDWIELLTDPLKGFIKVEIDAPNVINDGTPAIGIDTTVSFAPSDTFEGTVPLFTAAHEAALAVFKRVVKSSAYAISG